MNSYEDRKAWLASLKAGDRVALPGRYGAGGHIDVVERTTKTLIVLKSGVRFRRVDGREMSSSIWSRPSIQPVTKEFLDAVELEAMRAWLQATSDRRRDISVDVLKAMKAAYEDAAAKKQV